MAQSFASTISFTWRYIFSVTIHLVRPSSYILFLFLSKVKERAHSLRLLIISSIFLYTSTIQLLSLHYLSNISRKCSSTKSLLLKQRVKSRLLLLSFFFCLLRILFFNILWDVFSRLLLSSIFPQFYKIF